MNDRFKFRVWWEREKRYRIDAKIHPIEKFVIEQCTGLKDKNGNLIYEGDIVKAVTNTYKVIWDRYRWAIKDSQGYIFSEYINDLLYDCEIIGNIHEHAEQKDK